MKQIIFALMIFLILLSSGCSDKYVVSNLNIAPSEEIQPEITSPSPTQGNTPVPAVTPVQTTAPSKSIQNTFNEATPFPDDGKVKSWSASKEFPDYAYNLPNTPKELYKYSLNQQKPAGSTSLTVTPVNFYYQTTSQKRNSLLNYFKDFVNSYYNQDYTKANQWSDRMRGFLDPKAPVTLINKKTPDDFISDATNKITSGNIIMTVQNIITDDSLMYLDCNANYRVRGRISVNVTSSSDTSITIGLHTYDIELAFSKKLLSGPSIWASQDYIACLLIDLK